MIYKTSYAIEAMSMIPVTQENTRNRVRIVIAAILSFSTLFSSENCLLLPHL